MGLGHGTAKHQNNKKGSLETQRYQRYLSHLLAEQELREVVFNAGGEELKKGQ
jgi:hypothetical protein